MPNLQLVDLLKEMQKRSVFILHEHSGAFHTAWQAHPLGRLLLTERGILHIKVKGKQLLVPSWYCAWIPASTAHEIWSSSRKLFIRNVYFESSFCNNPCFHKLSIFNSSELFRNMIRHTAKWNRSSSEDLYELTFATVLRQMMPEEMKNSFTVALPASEHKDFQQIVEYVNQHYHEGLCLADILNNSTFSLRTLQRLFSRETGLSFSSYLKITRIIKAVELLSSSTMRVSEVAWAVGYNSVPTFNNTFRQVTGYRPEHFQRVD